MSLGRDRCCEGEHSLLRLPAVRSDRITQIAEISPGAAADFEYAIARPQRQVLNRPGAEIHGREE